MNKKILMLVIIIFCFIRLYNLGSTNLATDEAKTALGVDFPHSFVLPAMSVISQDIFGINEISVRLPFALIGILGIILFYFLGKEIYDKKTGVLFAFLASVLPANIILSRSAFLDIPLIVSWILILIFWLRYEKSKSNINIVFLFLSLFISPWMKIQAIYMFVILFIDLVIKTKALVWRDKRFYLLILSFIPFGFYILSQPQQLYDLVHYTSNETGIVLSNFWLVLKLLWQAYGVLIFLALFGILNIIFRKKVILKEERLMLIMFIIIFLVFIAIPKRFYYSVMADIPVVFFSACFLQKIIKTKKLKIIIISIIIINSVFILFYNNNFYNKFFQKNISEYDQISNKILKIPNPVVIFLDTNLGFNSKWKIKYETKKLDQLLENKNKFDNINIIVIIKDSTYEKLKNNFFEFKVYNYKNIKLLIKKQ